MLSSKLYITAVEELDKTRVKVYLNQEFAFVLYKGELRSRHLKQGDVLLPEVYEEITTQLLPKRAKLRCMNLLQKKQYTERQLRDKLKQGHYTPYMIDIAIDYVKSFGYVDDVKFAADYITYYSDYRSRKRIMQDLQQKGVSGSDIEAAYQQATELEDLASEIDLIRQLCKKKHYDAETADYEQKQKMMAFLYRKGFRMDNIQRALDITYFID